MSWTCIMPFLLTSCKEGCLNIHHNNNYDGLNIVCLTFIALSFVIVLLCFIIIYMYKANKRMTEEHVFIKEQLSKIKEEQQNEQEEKKMNDTFIDENFSNIEEKIEPTQEPLHEFDSETMDMIEKAMEEQKLYLIQDLNLKLLADKMNITQKKILEAFKHHPEYANLSTYLNHKRISHACALLYERPKHTIEAVASDSGFSSPITFYRWFEKETGMKPKEYREKVLKDKANNT